MVLTSMNDSTIRMKKVEANQEEKYVSFYDR